MASQHRVSAVFRRFGRRSRSIGAMLPLVALIASWPASPRAAEAQPARGELIAADGGQPFDDVRDDAVLAGLRVTVDKYGLWNVLYSIQPIYRLKNGEVVRGAIHGADHGQELVSEAKPGYALGQLVVSRGGRIDGLRCVFMRLDNGKLDPTDRYEGRWLGALSPDKPIELSTGGKIAIGLQGRTEDEVHGVGLLLAPSGPDAPKN